MAFYNLENEFNKALKLDGPISKGPAMRWQRKLNDSSANSSKSNATSNGSLIQMNCSLNNKSPARMRRSLSMSNLQTKENNSNKSTPSRRSRTPDEREEVQMSQIDLTQAQAEEMEDQAGSSQDMDVEEINLNISSSDGTAKSAIWKVFTSTTEIKTSDKGTTKETTAKCRRCDKSFVLKRSNTSNLWSHLENRHLADFIKHAPEKIQKQRAQKIKISAKPASELQQGQGDIRDSLRRMQPYAKSSKDYKERTDAVIDYIVADGRPLSTVESKSFCKMLAKFDSRYKPPSRRDLSESEIPAKYRIVKTCLQKMIDDAKYVVGDRGYKLPLFNFTTDLWSSCIMEPYISLTIHFVSKDFELQSLTLESKYIPDSHTGVNLAEALSDLLELWNMTKEDLLSITTDSAANMIKMGQEAVVLRLPCFGHLLHNGVTKAMNDGRIKRVTGKVKRIVAYFHQSHKKQQLLEIELAKNDKTPLHLVSECPTRWGSTYDMYSRIKSQLQEIKRVLVDDNATHLIPHHDDIDVINSVCEALHEYHYMTDGLSGENTPTASSVLPLTIRIKKLQYARLSHTMSMEIRAAIYDYINCKLITNHDAVVALLKCSMLDPRFCYKVDKLVSEDIVAENFFVQAKLELQEILTKAISNSSATVRTVGSRAKETQQTETAEGRGRKRRSNLARLMDDGDIQVEELQPVDPEVAAAKQISSFISLVEQQPRLAFDDCPLVWWRQHKALLPDLAEIARAYLGVQATSCASERLFSRSKTPTRTTVGDRFIPNRSSTDFESAHHRVSRVQPADSSNSDASTAELQSPSKAVYERVMSANLNGQPPAKILAFRQAAPAAPEGHLNNLRVLYSQHKTPSSTAKKSSRHIPSAPERILDAPDLLDDFYLNLISWSSSNLLAVALGSRLYVWNASTGDITQLMELDDAAYICSVSWVKEGSFLAVGSSSGETQIWDTSAEKRLRSMFGHESRVGSLAWNTHLLSSGSRTGAIHQHDVRVAQHHIGTFSAHIQEVCGLQWSPDGKYLASGGNDNVVNIWSDNFSRSNPVEPVHSFNQHQAAVKAISWCPWQHSLLASGGGTSDRCIKFWNCNTGVCINSVDTKSQVCSILWSREHRELITSHGYPDHHLSIWKYPTMTRVADLLGHTARVLHTAMSPDGNTVVSGAADETLRLWKCFATDPTKSKKSAQSKVAVPFSKGIR